jgi:hypothetical protein
MSFDQAQVGDLLIGLRADVASLKKDLDQARAETRRATQRMADDAGAIQGAFESLKKPLKEMAHLSAGLAGAFGGVKSEGLNVVRELATGFGGAGPIGIALAGAATLIGTIVEKEQEAGTAAKDAAEKAGKAHDEEKKKIEEKLGALDKYILSQQRSREIEKHGELQVTQKETLSTTDEEIRKAGEKKGELARQLAEQRGQKNSTGGEADPAASKALYAQYSEQSRVLRDLEAKRDADVDKGDKEHAAQTHLDKMQFLADSIAQEMELREGQRQARKRLLDLSSNDEREKALNTLKDELEEIDQTARNFGNAGAAEKARIAARTRYVDKMNELEVQRLQTIYKPHADVVEANRRRNDVQDSMTDLQGMQRRLQFGSLKPGDAEKKDQDKRTQDFLDKAPTPEELSKFESLNEAYTQGAIKAKAFEDSQKALGAAVDHLGGQFAEDLIKPLEDGFNGIGDIIDGLTSALADIAKELAKDLLIFGLKSAFGIATGGTSSGLLAAFGMAEGGRVAGPGGPTDDLVPTWLSAGEYVVKGSAVDAVGVNFLDSLNDMRMPHFADGGLVGGGGGRGAGIGMPSSSVVVNNMAFEAMSYASLVGRVVDRVDVRRMDNNQGGLRREKLRQAVGRVG